MSAGRLVLPTVLQVNPSRDKSCNLACMAEKSPKLGELVSLMALSLDKTLSCQATSQFNGSPQSTCEVANY